MTSTIAAPRHDVRVEVAPPHDDPEVRALLAEQRAFIERTLHLDLTEVQPGADLEYTEPHRFYRPPTATLLVGSVDRRPAGIVGLRRIEGRRGELELKRMYVRPSARGTGLGRALAIAAVEAARELGAATLRLQTHPETMAAAVAIYRAVGFVDGPRFPGVLDFDGAHTMVLDLSAPDR